MSTLTATIDAADARVGVNLNWSDANPVPTTATIERVASDGTVMAVRGADPATLAGGQWAGLDYEAPVDVEFYYQATSTSLPGTTLTTGQLTMPSGNISWLRSPGQPALNMPVTIITPPTWDRPITQGVFDVLGRSRPVAVSQRRSSERGDLVVATLTEDERQALLALVADGSILYLTTPGGWGVGSVYVAVADISEARPSALGSDPFRLFTLSLTVVDRPSGAALAAGNSWSDVLGAFTSWSQLSLTTDTWAVILEGVD